MQEVNIYIWNDIKSPGKKNAGTYIYIVEMANTRIKGSIKGIKTVPDVTAHQLELMSLIEALKRFNKKCILNIYTASSYMLGAINNEWVYGWKDNGWKTSSGKEVAHRQEWEELLSCLEGHMIHVCELTAQQRLMLETEMYRGNRKVI